MEEFEFLITAFGDTQFPPVMGPSVDDTIGNGDSSIDSNVLDVFDAWNDQDMINETNEVSVGYQEVRDLYPASIAHLRVEFHRPTIPSGCRLQSHLFLKLQRQLRQQVQGRGAPQSIRYADHFRTRELRKPILEGNNKFGSKGTEKCFNCRRHRQKVSIS